MRSSTDFRQSSGGSRKRSSSFTTPSGGGDLSGRWLKSLPRNRVIARSVGGDGRRGTEPAFYPKLLKGKNMTRSLTQATRAAVVALTLLSASTALAQLDAANA